MLAGALALKDAAELDDAARAHVARVHGREQRRDRVVPLGLGGRAARGRGERRAAREQQRGERGARGLVVAVGRYDLTSDDKGRADVYSL